MTLDDALRAAIRGSGLSLWAISLMAGVHYGELHRFMAREGLLSLSSADRICKMFGMTLTAPSYATCEPAKAGLQELPGQTLRPTDEPGSKESAGAHQAASFGRRTAASGPAGAPAAGGQFHVPGNSLG